LGGLVLFGLILNFFRNPEIIAEQNIQNILSPCDGKVVVIEEIQDEEYFNKKVIQVSIFMSPLNVHVNRNPIGGKVKYMKYHKGKFLVAFNPKSSTLNEHTYVVTENENITIGYKQIAGYVARRIKCYIKENDEVIQGTEYGFIKFGSRIDLLLPTDCEISVSLGDTVKAGRSVIAKAN
jgi:phosphatidylserine decarboxylase